jgi:type IV pilus biogenesis protein CpaD/CtpE
MMAVAAALLLALGCVARRPIAGRNVPAERVREIVPQTTTEREIVERFGAPDSVLTYPDGSKEFRYSYTGWRDRTVNLLVYSRTTTEKEHKSLSVRLQNGIVTRVAYMNTANPGESISK